MQIDTLIGAKARFVGDLVFEGTLRLDGVFEGTIRAEGDAMLIVSETAKIKGDIDVPHLRLHGQVVGNVRAVRSVLVGAKGRLTGDLEYAKLAIEEGASINGRCVRLSEEKAQQPAKAQAAAGAQARPQPAKP